MYSLSSMMKSLCLLLLLGVVNFHTVHGSGEVRIKFIKYENDKGKGANGQCCDGKYGICQKNGCDHMFSVCLDAPGKANDITRCQFGKYQSTAIKNRNFNIFDSSIANLKNPLVFKIDTVFPAEFDFKVVVFDHDHGVFARGNDHVDTLTQRMKTQPEQMYTTKHRTKLVFEASMVCSNGYYGTNCGTHCPAPSDTSHYECDSTGQKVCLQGWTGADCLTEEKKPCDNNPCQNGGICVEQGGAAACKCTSDFKGALCELLAATPAPKINPCDTLKCDNGGHCLGVSDTDAKCVCVGDFTGSKCETPVKIPMVKPAPTKPSEPVTTEENVETEQVVTSPAPTIPPKETSSAVKTDEEKEEAIATPAPTVPPVETSSAVKNDEDEEKEELIATPAPTLPPMETGSEVNIDEDEEKEEPIATPAPTVPAVEIGSAEKTDEDEEEEELIDTPAPTVPPAETGSKVNTDEDAEKVESIATPAPTVPAIETGSAKEEISTAL
uniref:Delta-like protein n=1 Tax=Platynereis dumerilii TaxID=6359 RepID=A0A1C6ZZW8_PLADU|nr:delta-like transmembrane protein 3 [Platynereis dumerilii]